MKNQKRKFGLIRLGLMAALSLFSFSFISCGSSTSGDDDASPAWTFVDGNTKYGINKDTTKNAGYPYLAVLNSKLYNVWHEYN